MSKKSCFVIAPIGEKASETRKRSDQVLKHIITPAITSCGFADPVRADQIAEPGLITSQVIQHVVEDDLVVADLTERNPNAFYELAIRHAIRKPLIQIIRKGDVIPFDVAGMRTIQFDTQDLDSVEETKKEIANQIRHMESHPKEIETPISVSLNLQALKGSDKPEDRSFAELLSVIVEIRTSFAEVQKRLGSPETLLPPEYVSHLLRRIEGPGRIHPQAVRDVVLGLRRLAKEFPQIKDAEAFMRMNQALDYLEDRLKFDAREHVSPA